MSAANRPDKRIEVDVGRGSSPGFSKGGRRSLGPRLSRRGPGRPWGIPSVVHAEGRWTFGPEFSDERKELGPNLSFFRAVTELRRARPFMDLQFRLPIALGLGAVLWRRGSEVRPFGQGGRAQDKNRNLVFDDGSAV